MKRILKSKVAIGLLLLALFLAPGHYLLGPFIGNAAGQQTTFIGSGFTQLLNGIEGQKATYSVSQPQITPASTPTDLLILTAPAAKTDRLLRVSVSCIATSAGALDVVLLQRTTAPGGGTATAVTPLNHDSGLQAAAASVVSQYSANITTLGTLGANFGDKIVNCGVAGSANIGTVTWDFTNHNDRAPVLRAGTGQNIAVNLNSQALPTGAKISYELQWSEE